MPYTAKSYLERAEECVRLANMAKDDMVQAALLKLRQSYLQTADRLTKIEGKRD